MNSIEQLKQNLEPWIWDMIHAINRSFESEPPSKYFTGKEITNE